MWTPYVTQITNTSRNWYCSTAVAPLSQCHTVTAHATDRNSYNNCQMHKFPSTDIWSCIFSFGSHPPLPHWISEAFCRWFPVQCKNRQQGSQRCPSSSQLTTTQPEIVYLGQYIFLHDITPPPRQLHKSPKRKPKKYSAKRLGCRGMPAGILVPVRPAAVWLVWVKLNVFAEFPAYQSVWVYFGPILTKITQPAAGCSGTEWQDNTQLALAAAIVPVNYYRR